MQYQKISARPRSPIFRTEWWRNGTPLLTNAAVLLLGAVLLEFTGTGVGEYSHYVHGFSETVLVQIVVYLGAIVLLELCPTNNWTLRIVLLIALAVRLIALIAPPFLSTDIYRYVWDGLVQGAGINPFRYIPADSHLAFLRDANIYPNINRRDYAHTIYPPGSQLIFLGGHADSSNCDCNEVRDGGLRSCHLLRPDPVPEAAAACGRSAFCCMRGARCVCGR